MAQAATPNVHEMHRTIRMLHPPGNVVELFTVSGGNGRKPINKVGFFTNIACLVSMASSESADAEYIQLNEIDSLLLQRTPHRLVYGATAASDRDVRRRQWMLLDHDVKRPSGTSAMPDQIEAAHEATQKTASFIAELGWPEPVVAFSGNGYHLLYRVDLPPDDGGLVKNAIAKLSKMFSDDVIEIDRAVHNPIRLVRLYGSPVRKGGDPRLHRTSEIVQSPYEMFDQFEAVGEVELRDLIEFGESTSGGGGGGRPKRQQNSSGYVFDLEGFISEHGIDVVRIEPLQDGGQRYLLQRCLFDESHDKPGVAALIRAGGGGIGYKCQHDSCSGKSWRDVRELFGDTKKKPKSRKSQAAKGPSKQTSDNDAEILIAAEIARNVWHDPVDGEVALRNWQESFFTWDERSKRWVPKSDSQIQSEITFAYAQISGRPRERTIRELAYFLRMMTMVPAEMEMAPFWASVQLAPEGTDGAPINTTYRESSDHVIRVQNGIVDIAKLIQGESFDSVLLPHSRSLFNLVTHAWRFPTTAEEEACDEWIAFLDRVFDGDKERIAVLQEMFGLCFWPSHEHKFERAWMLYGLGANGKSTVVDMLEYLLHPDNISSLSAKDIIDGNELITLHNKLANLCTEMPRFDIATDDALKRIISQERITARRKYKTAVSFRPTAKLVFLTNALTSFTDPSQGLWRKLQIIPFNWTVPVSERDPAFFTHILRPEAPGVFLWAMEGLRRVMQKQELTVSEECERVKREHMHMCFPIAMFLDDACDIVSGSSVSLKTMHRSYQNWCRMRGYGKRPKPIMAFLRDVMTFLKDRVDAVKGDGGRYHIDSISLRGIIVRPSFLTNASIDDVDDEHQHID